MNKANRNNYFPKDNLFIVNKDLEPSQYIIPNHKII